MKGMGRTVFVGDVHGCVDELDALLEAVAFTARDRLVLVGDLVARGPASTKVLERARSTGARAVRGNHEARILEWRAGGRKTPLGEAHRAVVDAMSEDDWALVAALPLWLELPEHGALVVHAGLVPGVALADQSPHDLVNLRVVADGSGRRVPWATLHRGPPHVLFGHDAVRGLQLHPWATGLDTGCVYGGELTALVLEDGEPVPRDPAARTLVRVAAARTYFDPVAHRATSPRG